MHLRHSAAALVVLGFTQVAWAQEPAARQPGAQVVQPQQAAVDVSRLPVDIARIQRQLMRNPTEREERDGLRLRYFVGVYGQAPPIVLFTKEDNLVTGPVPYGAPTHKDMIYMMTPEEFRAPAADFGALFRWLADKAKK